MARTSLKSKGRRGGEAERFAYIPESLLDSEAGQTLPYAALKVLAILIVGKSKERNGTMCCSDSHAKRYGPILHDTLRRSLVELQRRCIIVVTRKVQRFQKWPTLYGVTWWPITHRDGQPLDYPEAPSLGYLTWTETSPKRAKRKTPKQRKFPHPDSRGTITPIVGAVSAVHHPDGRQDVPFHHPDGRGESLDLGRGHEFTRVALTAHRTIQ